jgi:DNA-binding transcriptional LysR family regulator
MNSPDLSHLSLFVRVAEEQSFTAAAQAMGMSKSAASYVIRQLEKQVGTKLFNRTTRSVSLTEEGRAFLARIEPLLEQLDLAFGDIGRASSATAGTLRLNVPPSAISLVISPILREFLRAYPEINIDVMSENSLVDIASKGYDAGIRYDNVLSQDMVAIPLVTNMRFCIVASPEYLETKGMPTHPRDLLTHECINYRSAETSALYRWEFQKGDERIRIAVAGRIATNDNDLLLRSALDGFGFSYLQHRTAEPYIRAGRLVSALDDWVPREALYLYYYNPDGMPRKLRAFIDFVRAHLK